MGLVCLRAPQVADDLGDFTPEEIEDRAREKLRRERASELLGDQHVAAGDLMNEYSSSSGHTAHRIVRVYDTKVNVHADGEAAPLDEGTTRYSSWPGEKCWLCGEWRPVRVSLCPALASARVTG